ncbi:hypothetical protein ILUMI_09011 [Ignelater luminosus]|uniref:Tudor domain-containing protein 7 n=1 Tax=Ignelater luminosus TaxID=2038154 RepID=A0A8K0D543_IGNLU|nr:hypothetical protein ILUMI_09011 [Ignelater luminosus]
MAEKGKDEVIAGIRSCLVSVKGKCDLKQISDDFYMLMGYKIPYSQLGYKSLEQFILSISTLSTTRVGNQLLVDAKPTEKSSHIASLVDKQKATTKKRRPPPRRMTNRNFNSPPAVSRWKPKNVNRNKPYQSSPRPAAVSHNQFVKVPLNSNSKQPLTTAPRLANRLNAIKESPPQAPSVEPSIKREKGLEVEKENDPNSLTKKAKKRITERMADINLNSNNINTNGTNGLTNWNIEAESYATTQTLSPTAIQKLRDESLAAADYQSSVWGWSSSNDESPERDHSRQKPKRSNKSPDINIQYTGDFVVDLQNFVKSYELDEPCFTTKTRVTKIGKMKTTCYISHIKVGSNSYSSYPNEFLDEPSAKQMAAKLALEDLSSKCSKPQPLLISDNKDILERIPPLVQSHFSGVWNTQLEADYADKFNEQLPVNWLEIVDTVPCITVLPLLDKKFVLRFCKPGEKGNNFATPLVSHISIPSNTVKFDDNGLLLAEITCVASAGEIWCRQIYTPESELFMETLVKLEEYYNNYGNNEKVETVEVGGYYVASFENVWSRVRVFEINGNDISCFCIDFGDEWVLQKNNLYRLPRHFAMVAAQAFVCRLAGVEELYEASKSSDYLNSLFGKYVQVQLDTSSEDAGRGSPNDPALPVILYDIEAEIVINEQLISFISMESASPVLSKNSPTEVFVTYALDDGSVYVQVHSVGFEQLNTMLEELEKNLVENKTDLQKVSITPENSKDKLYFAHYDKDGHWYRAKIIDWSPDKKHVQILYVDYGNTSVIKLSDKVLYPLDELSDVISKFPNQAIRVRMALDHIPSNFVEKITSLMPSDQPVLVKLIKDNSDERLVEFFKRSETDNVLFSVNSALSVETEFKNASGDGNNNSGKLQSTKIQRLISLNQFDSTVKNVPSSGFLSCPPLPKVGNYLDVKIPFAVNPYNFFIQPYESHEKLKQVMIALQERYKDSQHSPLHIEDIQPGRIYASKHEDGVWYR